MDSTEGDKQVYPQRYSIQSDYNSLKKTTEKTSKKIYIDLQIEYPGCEIRK